MRDITSVTIDELILHILDPQGQGLVLSSIPLPLQDNPNLLGYFNRHILNSLRDRGIKAAKFRNINPEQPSGVCRDLLRGELDMVQGSQHLARALYGIMEEDRRITPGDLGVCSFRADNYPYTQFLAILKIDPSQIFQHVIKEDRQGNTYVSFEAVPQAFTEERLQKCAFIQPLDPRHPEYDMLLLDRQRWDSEEGRIARFFSEMFLDAVETYDSRKYTESLYKSLVGAQNSVRERLSEEEEDQLEDSINAALSHRRMNLDDWLSDLKLDEEIKAEIDQAISTTIPAREFPLDRSYSACIASKVKFRGDHNLRVEMPFENYRSLIVSEERVSDDPDRPPYYRIVIETDSWQRLT